MSYMGKAMNSLIQEAADQNEENQVEWMLRMNAAFISAAKEGIDAYGMQINKMLTDTPRLDIPLLVFVLRNTADLLETQLHDTERNVLKTLRKHIQPEIITIARDRQEKAE